MPDNTPAPILSDDAIATIIERDMPGFMPAPKLATSPADLAFRLPKADYVAPAANPERPVTPSDVIAVKVVPKRASDTSSPFPAGRTVLINTRLKRVQGAQG
jgi:hypothetical protein